MLNNLAFSLSLYSGQMCTTPQNLLVPRTGIDTDQGAKSYDDVVRDLAAAIEGLLSDDARAAAVLGAVVNPGVLQRSAAAAGGEYGELALAPRAVEHPEFPGATVRTPALVKLDADKPDDRAVLRAECFGPVSFAVAVEDTAAAVELLRDTVRTQGAMTAAAYTTSPEVEAALVGAALDSRRLAVPQPHRRGVRQPDRRLLRPARHRRQPGRQLRLLRRRLRRQPVPHRGDPPPQLSPRDRPVPPSR